MRIYGHRKSQKVNVFVLHNNFEKLCTRCLKTDERSQLLYIGHGFSCENRHTGKKSKDAD